ncbi:hypothetical protein GCM10011611_63350 [Aliidongia dinghuensis]|uniref:DUF2325 domain-containing protein n=1 Tax=Aliidongia dinghuensis TaxID=1867774 RepID=A0A8J2Z1A5_9PROT|nr:DUF2325 domain-containing protein [Aliidongia dinghuensis]GGF48269.1 hypothetical protein GCM10011611_63350 [Aliidongia dinghuensis]
MGQLKDAPAFSAVSDDELAAMLNAPAKRRSRIWDLAPNLHCSIVGTCLSTRELRQIVGKLGGRDLDALSDHEIHGEGVRLAGRHDDGGKLLQKALDKRHHAALNRFAAARSADAVAAFWDEAKRAGEIPGAYWALLSHPAATDALVKQAFADVHMLSHLVGAANRADIRRLTALEKEKAELERKLEKSQAHIQTADATIRQLDAALAAAVARNADKLATGKSAETADDEVAALRRLVGELDARLRTEAARALRAERRAEKAQRDLAASETARQQAGARADTLAEELAAIEAELAPPEASSADLPAGDGRPSLPPGIESLLYVGGRPAEIRRLRAFADRADIELLHHDGGIEDRSGLLPGLVSRADVACFPVDCISHDAAAAVKRLCRQAGKPFLPLRSVGIGSLLAGLGRLDALAVRS